MARMILCVVLVVVGAAHTIVAKLVGARASGGYGGGGHFILFLVFNVRARFKTPMPLNANKTINIERTSV